MFESIRGHKIQFVIAAIAVAGMMMYAIPAPQLVIASQDDDIQYCFSAINNNNNNNNEDQDVAGMMMYAIPAPQLVGGAQFCYDTMEECENGRADHPGASDCEIWHRH
jgi:hypothetical protein